MKRNPRGAHHSIFNSSTNAHRAINNFLAYSVSKAAAVHCGEKGYGTQVSGVLPGVVETALMTDLIEGSSNPATTVRRTRECRHRAVWRKWPRSPAWWLGSRPTKRGPSRAANT